jgi:hypothetical protein
VRTVLAESKALPAIRDVIFCCFSAVDLATYVRILGDETEQSR